MEIPGPLRSRSALGPGGATRSRKIGLGQPGAVERLRAIDAEIAELRRQL